jgi:hypothetical protein
MRSPRLLPIALLALGFAARSERVVTLKAPRAGRR